MKHGFYATCQRTPLGQKVCPVWGGGRKKKFWIFLKLAVLRQLPQISSRSAFLSFHRMMVLRNFPKPVICMGAPLAILVCSMRDKAWRRPQDGHSMGGYWFKPLPQPIWCSSMDGWHWLLLDNMVWSRNNQTGVFIARGSDSVNILVLGYADEEKKTEAQSPNRHEQKTYPAQGYGMARKATMFFYRDNIYLDWFYHEFAKCEKMYW